MFLERKPNFFSTLDMLSGYHHVKMAEDSKKFTGFTTPDGEHLACNRLCFGYVTPPRILCVESKGYSRYCQVYLYDFIIFSPNVSHHIVELRDTLFVLKKQG